jgi:hypothetical protein
MPVAAVAHHASAGKIYASLTSQNLLEISPTPQSIHSSPRSPPGKFAEFANKSKIKTNHNRMIKKIEST